MSFSDKDTQRKLIDASNLICQHIEKKLPEGWQIEFMHSRNESTITLIDPFGTNIECSSADVGISTIDDMCETAIYHESTENSNCTCPTIDGI